MNEAGAEPGPTRVVVLARPGPACDHLQQAVRDARAELVLVADPTVASAGEVAAVAPGAVLVALDPAVEDALERFDALLADPAMIVVYDEAVLAAQRTGWDAARWSRHLAAKLNRHDDVLPPGAESDTSWHPAPGLSRADGTPAGIATVAGEPATMASDVRGGLYGDGLLLAEDLEFVDDGSLSFDGEAFPALEAAGAGHAAADWAAPEWAAPERDFLPDAPASSDDTAEPLAANTASWLEDALLPANEDPALPLDVAGAGLSTLQDDGDGDGNGLALLDDDATALALAAETANPAFVRDLDELERRVAGIELADVDSYGHGPLRGAVLVDAGLGGPDAVRQLLAQLPVAFPRPVLVRLRLDGGRYDRLVKQMEKATRLPVAIARAGQVAEPGQVYFLAPAIGVVQQAARLVFTDDAAPASLFAALPPGDSAALFLSGGDADLVAHAMHGDWAGALVAGQALDGCYDASASCAVTARGGATGTPSELADQLAARWPS